MIARINPEKTRSKERTIRARASYTYLLPCGLQTIMDFSLATLPVETALIFWTFWTWAMDCMVIIVCIYECVYGDFKRNNFTKNSFFISYFLVENVTVLDACSFFLCSLS